MAASQANREDKSCNSNPILSDYASKLDNNVQKRYTDKISVIGIDPFLIPTEKLSTEEFPPVEACDILSYLVLETSFYSKDQFKNFRSLQAYNQTVSGFISSVLGQVVNDKSVVVAKVRHSQRMNDPHVPLWIIVSNEGAILSAHCAGCMAGLGECCSHVASVLFYLECWNRIHGKLACTQIKCTWLLPPSVKQAAYAKAKDIDFSSASKLKNNLDNSIQNLTAVKSEGCERGQTGVAEIVAKPTDEEINNFVKSLGECKTKPVCLSLDDEHYESFISSTRNVKTIPDLFVKSHMDLSYTELLQKCYEVEIELTKEEIEAIESDTVDQAKGKAFFRHRAGRIGASKCHAVCHSDPAQPSQSLIKTICYPDVFQFSSNATKHGCKHEESAIKAYESVIKNTHENFVITKSGTVINQEHQFLHATPDFYCECSCCGKGCGEVKCPYCIDGLDFNDNVKKKSSCLEKKGTGFSLKKEHSYYYQAQQQLHTTKRAYLDFVVFAEDGEFCAFFHQRIAPDHAHWNAQLPKLEKFWRICIMPEIMGRWYTRKMDLMPKLMPDRSKPGECYCRQSKTADDIILCANPECKIAKFHKSCLCIEKIPAVWFCPHCRKMPKFKKKKQAVNDDQTEAFNLDKICLCQTKAQVNDKLLKCHSINCSSGKFFHLSCLSYKCFPNNAKTSWVCSHCKLANLQGLAVNNRKQATSNNLASSNNVNSKPAAASTSTSSNNMNSKPATATASTSTSSNYMNSKPATASTSTSSNYMNSKPATASTSTSSNYMNSKPATASTSKSNMNSKPVKNTGSSSITSEPDVIELKETVNTNIDKTSSYGKLTADEYKLIEDPEGWLDCTIIHQAQIYLKKVNSAVEGFQRPTLGACRNFNIVTSEFIQILHTGGNHWVCVSSIGCKKGHVYLYDSLASGVVAADIEEQVESLVGEKCQITVVSVQRQTNKSDCGVFSIANATGLVFMCDPRNIQFDIPRMRHHLVNCLRSGRMELFPTKDVP